MAYSDHVFGVIGFCGHGGSGEAYFANAAERSWNNLYVLCKSHA